MKWVSYLPGLILGALLMPMAVRAEDQNTPGKSFGYAHGDFFTWGYYDKTVTVDHWKIQTKVNNRIKGRAPIIALYRLALYAKANRFKAFDVTEADYTLFYGMYVNNQSAVIAAVGVAPDAPLSACTAETEFQSYCRRYDTDQALVEFQNIIGMTDADTAAEVAKIKPAS